MKKIRYTLENNIYDRYQIFDNDGMFFLGQSFKCFDDALLYYDVITAFLADCERTNSNPLPLLFIAP